MGEQINEEEKSADRMKVKASRLVENYWSLKQSKGSNKITLENFSLAQTDKSLGSHHKNIQLIGGGRPKIVKAPKLWAIKSTNQQSFGASILFGSCLILTKNLNWEEKETVHFVLWEVYLNVLISRRENLQSNPINCWYRKINMK